MSIYDPMEILEKRALVKKEDKDLIYKCTWCGSDINLNDERSPDTFKNDTSFKEFIISGLCQKCQGETFDELAQCDGHIAMCNPTFEPSLRCRLQMGHPGPCMNFFKMKEQVVTVTWSKITGDENDQS